MAIKDPQIAARLKPETMAWVEDQAGGNGMKATWLRKLLEDLHAKQVKND
jgi:hypothetical protein